MLAYTNERGGGSQPPPHVLRAKETIQKRIEHGKPSTQAYRRPAVKLRTSDLGIAIRDHFEGKTVHRFWNGVETTDRATVDFIDVSDPDNPLVHINGQMFLLHIVIAG